jgi:hypothetical protein
MWTSRNPDVALDIDEAPFTLKCGPREAAERLHRLKELGFDDALLRAREHTEADLALLSGGHTPRHLTIPRSRGPVPENLLKVANERLACLSTHTVGHVGDMRGP